MSRSHLLMNDLHRTCCKMIWYSTLQKELCSLLLVLMEKKSIKTMQSPQFPLLGKKRIKVRKKNPVFFALHLVTYVFCI